MFDAFRIPLSWADLFKRTAKESVNDDVLGLAAQLAYYFFLALFPAILFLLALIGLLPIQDFVPQVLASLSTFAPQDVLSIVRDQITKIAQSNNGGLLTFGFLGALWSSSAAMVAIVGSLNRAFDLEETRSWWKVRLVAIGLTVGSAIFIILSFALVLVGPAVAEALARYVGLGPAFTLTWRIVQWPVAFLLVSTGVGLVYYFAPNAEQDWHWITPGAALATLLWLLASLAFKFYISNFTDYNATYGAVGGVIVLLLWFYISGAAVLVGAEMASEIEHAYPHSREKVPLAPGQLRKLGARGEREYQKRLREQRERERRHVPAASSATEPQRTLVPPAAGSQAAVSAGAASGSGRGNGSPSLKLRDILVSAPVLIVSLFGRRRSRQS